MSEVRNAGAVPCGCPKCEVRGAKSEAPRTVSGFTLIEVLISLTILSLIFVAVLGAIQVGAKSWESGEARAEESQRNRTLVEALARDLTMIHPLRVQEQDKDVIAFHGKSDSLEFATLPQSYGAEPFSHMVRIVAYAVEPGRGLVATGSYPLAAQASASLEDSVKPLDERALQAGGKSSPRLARFLGPFPGRDAAVPSSEIRLCTGAARPEGL